MKLSPADQKRFEAQIAELIRTGKMPSLEQVLAAVAEARTKFLPLIAAARDQAKQAVVRSRQ